MKLIYTALLFAAVLGLSQAAMSATKHPHGGQSKYINGVKWDYTCLPASWVMPCYQNEGSFSVHFACDPSNEGFWEPAKCLWMPEEPVHPDMANRPR